MEINDNMDKIYLDDLIFYKINGVWWECYNEHEEIYKNGLSIIAPVIKREVTFDYIVKTHLRKLKIQRLLKLKKIKKNSD